MVKQFIVYNVTGETEVGEVDSNGVYVLVEDYEALRLALVKFIQRLDSERCCVEEGDIVELQDHMDAVVAKLEEAKYSILSLAKDLC